MTPEDKAQLKYHMLRDDYTIEELEEELERRKRESSKPVLIENPDLINLKNTCQSIINDVIYNNYYEDNDNPQYVYEAAMKAFFGENVFKWINKNII